MTLKFSINKLKKIPENWKSSLAHGLLLLLCENGHPAKSNVQIQNNHH